MKKAALFLILLFSTVLLNAQGNQLPSFGGTTFPALVGQTGSCDISVMNATAIYKPYKTEFFPEGSPTVVAKDSIMTDFVTVYNIPIGKFHFKLTFHNGMVLTGDCQIATKLPDGRIVYQTTTLIKYPDPPTK